MITTRQDYVVGAQRTLKRMPNHQMDHIHMQMGCMTEIGEMINSYKIHHIYGKPFDAVNLNEEFGDTAWYIANDNVLWCTNEQEVRMAIYDPHELVYTLRRLETDWPLLLNQSGIDVIVNGWMDFIGDFVNHKHWNHERMWTNFFILGLQMGVDIPLALTRNIEKLQARYPDKYTDFAALNRNLDNERSILEGNGKAPL